MKSYMLIGVKRDATSKTLLDLAIYPLPGISDEEIAETYLMALFLDNCVQKDDFKVCLYQLDYQGATIVSIVSNVFEGGQS